MKHAWVSLVLIAVLLVVAAPVASQGTPTPASPLLADLVLVPDNTMTGNGWAVVRYVDYQALYTSEGIEPMRLTLDVGTLMKLFPLTGMLSRIMAGPDSLAYVVPSAERMPEVVGFDWVADVNRSLEYGALPEIGLLLAGTFDEAAVGAALLGRGFEQADVNGVTVWHRLEDAQMDPESREIADPFGGHLGLAARIASLPGYLINARDWAVMEDMIATFQGERGSLADNPDYRALAEAVSASDGQLIQALFFTPEDIGVAQPSTSALVAAYGALRPYTLAVLADRQEGDDVVEVIGLVYADAAQAQAAAEEVAARIRTMGLPQRPDAVLVEQYDAQVAVSVYESETAGNAVALVEVRYTLPADRIDPASGRYAPGGMLYRSWAAAIVQRVFSPLVITTE